MAPIAAALACRSGRSWRGRPTGFRSQTLASSDRRPDRPPAPGRSIPPKLPCPAPVHLCPGLVSPAGPHPFVAGRRQARSHRRGTRPTTAENRRSRTPGELPPFALDDRLKQPRGSWETSLPRSVLPTGRPLRDNPRRTSLPHHRIGIHSVDPAVDPPRRIRRTCVGAASHRSLGPIDRSIASAHAPTIDRLGRDLEEPPARSSCIRRLRGAEKTKDGPANVIPVSRCFGARERLAQCKNCRRNTRVRPALESQQVSIRSSSAGLVRRHPRMRNAW